MINCKRIERDHIQLLIDRRITPTQRAELDTHLASCPKCSALVESYKSVAQDAVDWAQAGAGSSLPETFTSNVLAAIGMREQREPVVKWQLAGISAVSFVAILLVAIISQQISFLAALAVPTSLANAIWIPRSLPDLFGAIQSVPGSILPSGLQFGVPWLTFGSSEPASLLAMASLFALAANLWFAYRAAANRRATQ